MKFERRDPPREFTPGMGIVLKDCGRVELSPDEQVTFAAEGSEYDFCRKAWGYYASPSLNARMGRLGLRPALVKSSLNGTYFLMAVLKGRQKEFEAYVKETGQSVVAWLDEAEALARFDEADRSCLCGGRAFDKVFHYAAPPEGEIRFKFSGEGYSRDILRCRACGHFLSVHGMDMSALYGGDYADATYGDKLRATFDKIIALPPSQSDNAGRVAWVTRHAKGQTVLDVGSGLCVFLHRMKAEGWKGTALDPDPRQAAHAKTVVGVDAVQADFMTVKDPGRYDLITFNKVLEHAVDPVAMLARAKDFLAPGGSVYVELPDGEGAAKDGPDREEFFIDHHHVFSAASYCVLASRAGFRVAVLETLREPSGKYTLRGILCPL